MRTLHFFEKYHEGKQEKLAEELFVNKVAE